jgi:hypothetical protein
MKHERRWYRVERERNVFLHEVQVNILIVRHDEMRRGYFGDGGL